MRRVVSTLAALCLALPGLTSCGSDDSEGNSGSVTVSGEFGSKPEVTYDGRVERETTDVSVLTEGSGEVIEEGDSGFVHLYIGNGFTGEEALSTWPEDPKGKEKPAPGAGQPELLAFDDAMLPAIHDAVVGQAVGSRVQVLAAPEDAYAESGGNPRLNIGNQDSVVFVIDILSSVLDGVDTSSARAPEGAPQVLEDEDGNVTGFDFTGAREIGKKLKVITLVEGDGPPVRKGSWMAMNYLGAVFGEKKPFDENYTAEQITPFQIGVDAVIQGWDSGLPGVKTGSRVLLMIPSDLAYGKAGQGKDIPPNSDLVFVVDVLGVA